MVPPPEPATSFTLIQSFVKFEVVHLVRARDSVA
jgi:hypothetical protein